MKFKFSPDLAMAGAGDGVAIESQELSAEVFNEGEADEPVTSKHTAMPDYPDRARELAIEKTVTATFVVDVDGGVSIVENVDAPHPVLASHVRKSIKGWKYNPARNRGIPVKQRVRQQLEFKLD